MHGWDLHCSAPKFTEMQLCHGLWFSGIAPTAQPADWLHAPGWVSAEAQGVELILQHFKSSLLFHICGGQDQGAGVSSVLWPPLQNTSLPLLSLVPWWPTAAVSVLYHKQGAHLSFFQTDLPSLCHDFTHQCSHAGRKASSFTPLHLPIVRSKSSTVSFKGYVFTTSHPPGIPHFEVF